ncbi:hypothetical protein J6590_101792 [Homalodisca vitripennis]|nr:hypothetical protein J6590_006902 [Homalodisca vitripennis]KAG8308779.1 hypothetical protein J6590_101792 [Homalodisca vitripennis]
MLALLGHFGYYSCHIMMRPPRDLLSIREASLYPLVYGGGQIHYLEAMTCVVTISRPSGSEPRLILVDEPARFFVSHHLVSRV